MIAAVVLLCVVVWVVSYVALAALTVRHLRRVEGVAVRAEGKASEAMGASEFRHAAMNAAMQVGFEQLNDRLDDESLRRQGADAALVKQLGKQGVRLSEHVESNLHRG